jgi:ABC-type glutathione transport system ATPase component
MEGGAAMSNAVLRVRLRAGYGKTRILQDVAFDLQAGGCLGLVGSSGAGKSTLVLALMGLLPWRGGWTQGEVLLHGRNLLTLKEREARRMRGKEIALVPQSPTSALNPSMSLRSQFQAAWRAHEPSSSGLQARIGQLLDQMRLPASDAFLERKPGQVSVGQAQRVALALALLHRPAVLIADEPTSALDPSTQMEVIDLLREVQREQNTALLYISHDLVSVLQLCDTVAVLNHGEIAACRKVEALDKEASPPALRALLRTLPVPIEVMLQHLRTPKANGEGEVDFSVMTKTCH